MELRRFNLRLEPGLHERLVRMAPPGELSRSVRKILRENHGISPDRLSLDHRIRLRISPEERALFDRAAAAADLKLAAWMRRILREVLY